MYQDGDINMKMDRINMERSKKGIRNKKKSRNLNNIKGNTNKGIMK